MIFQSGHVVKVSGERSDLCRDFEMAMELVPGLDHVGEVGLGQSVAVRAARDIHERGCIWREKQLGVHLGLGAELAEAFDAADRITGHHVDLVLATGSLVDCRMTSILDF